MRVSTVPIAPGRLPVLGHVLPLLRANRLEYMTSLRGFGEMVKIYLGPMPVYVLNSPELIHRLLVTDADKFIKGRIFQRTRPYLGNGILNSGGTFHRRQRRLIQPAFHREAVSTHAGLMIEATRRRTATWVPGSLLAVPDEMRAIAADVITHALFATDDARPLADLTREFLPRFTADVAMRTALPDWRLFDLPTPANRRLNRLRDQLRSAVRSLVATYQTDGPHRTDMVTALLAARDPDGTAMTDEELVDEIITLFVTGMETAAAILTWTWYELGRDPALRDRLHNELDEVLKGESATAEHLPRLRFTGALLNETLRLHHPTWILMRRSVKPIDLAGVHLPAGTEVLFSPATLYQDSKMFEDAARFNPDRWLDERPTCRAFIPFGAGKHKCAGEHFAWQELHLVLATIATHWTLDPRPDHHPKPVADSLVQINHLPMTPTPRG